MLDYFASYLVMAGIYSVAALALNLQWGFTGLMNFGMGAFYMLGAYTSAILTGPPTPEHVGGFGLPLIVGFAGAALLPGLIAFLIGFPALRFRGDIFAIVLLGIHETIFSLIKNESWLTGGVWGIRGIPRAMFELGGPKYYDYLFLAIVALVIFLIYLMIERAIRSPWGRVLRAIRGDEEAASMVGKNTWGYKMQSLILGSMIMGLAGALYVHYTGFVSPQVFTPLMATFIVWLMIMAGGAGSNKGAIIGAFFVWAVWIGSEFLTDLVPAALATRVGFIRMLAVGIVLEVILLARPQGIVGKRQTL